MYDPTLIGSGEARLIAIKQKVIKYLPDLNTALSRDSLTSYIIGDSFGGPVTASSVCIGDFRSGWDISTGAIRISVSATDYRQGTSFTQMRTSMPDSQSLGLNISLNTSVFLYLNIDWARVKDPMGQAEMREKTLTRIEDWLRAGCLSKWEGATLSSDVPLTSKEFSSVQLVDRQTNAPIVDADGNPCFDLLSDCYASTGFQGVMGRGPGDSIELLGIHMVHQGTIQR